MNTMSGYLNNMGFCSLNTNTDMNTLENKQKIWLKSIIYSTEDKRVRDWYLELPLTPEQTNMLHEIVLLHKHGYYYTDNEKELLNWLIEEYIKYIKNRHWNTYLEFIENCEKYNLNKDPYDDYYFRKIESRDSIESHHILPKGWGGDDSPSNVVRLSLSQHIIAHLILSIISADSFQWSGMLEILSRWNKIMRATMRYYPKDKFISEMKKCNDELKDIINKEIDFYFKDFPFKIDWLYAYKNLIKFVRKDTNKNVILHSNVIQFYSMNNLYNSI